MDIRERIAAIEAALKERRVSVAALCRRADLAPTTWVRWKAGTPAQERSWAKVADALGQIDPALRPLAALPPRGEAA